MPLIEGPAQGLLKWLAKQEWVPARIRRWLGIADAVEVFEVEDDRGGWKR